MSGKRDPAKSLKRLVKAIRSRRVSLGASQEDVAHASGMSVRHYQKIEAGTVDPRYKSLVALADGLSTDLIDLLK